jgi:hypothetical protein
MREAGHGLDVRCTQMQHSQQVEGIALASPPILLAVASGIQIQFAGLCMLHRGKIYFSGLAPLTHI